MNNKVQEILNIYKQTLENTQNALKEADVPDNMIELYLSRLPDFNKLLPEDVVKIFQDFRKAFVIYLDKRGFSQREIARRMGGSSQIMVHQILQEERDKEVKEDESSNLSQ